jgi:TolB-like protein/DNA-binding winged helix-turn-helix (wHTH) protein/lipopolysaccharide biosynthesis regulator YciM
MLRRPRKSLVHFGVFEFDPASGELWKAGRRIRLQDQPRQVLRILVSRGGELVTREELCRELWSDDTFVDFDNGLNVAIRKIRDVLGDLAGSPRFIETERARGYRFIAPVSQEPPSPDVENTARIAPMERATVLGEPLVVSEGATKRVGPNAIGRSRPLLVLVPVVLAMIAGASVWFWRVGLYGSAPLSASESSAPITLAVLPFASATGESVDFLTVGIPDGVITRLSNVRQFRVRPTSSVVRYHGADIDPQSVGRRLGSQYVLEGTIRATADRVRVSVRLVRTSDGSPVWGRQYDRAREDLLGIEDGIAEEIASALRVQMSEAERVRLHRHYTRSGAAYERYLVGRARLRSVTEEGALQAISEFEAARDLDPNYALAYAGLATAAAQLRVRFASQKGYEVWDARARQEAGRALQLDPDLAEAYVALAAVHRFQEYDWDTVISESQHALKLNPSLDMPHLYLAAAYFHIGLLDEAELEVKAARELNPDNQVEPLEILGAVNLFAGRAADALEYLLQAQGLSDSRIVRYLFGWALYYQGEGQRAETLLQSMIDEEGPLAVNARATLAALRAARGATSEARALAERAASERDLLHHAAYGLGTAYAQLGEPATALRWLSQGAATGFPCYPWYEHDPLLDPIRDDSRFINFMSELRRSWENARAKYVGRSHSATLGRL